MVWCCDYLQHRSQVKRNSRTNFWLSMAIGRPRNQGMKSHRLRSILGGVVTAVWIGCCAGETTAPPLRPWNDYQVIMWVGDTAGKHPEKFGLFLERLKEMGVTTGMVHHDADPRPFVDARFPYYVENVVNKGLCLKWNSNVRDWDAFVTQWARTGRPESAFVRDYCLDDPSWLDWAKGEAGRIGSRHAANRPLAYDLRDELSVTISANPFDYDFSPMALEGFRRWLRDRHASLAALGHVWGLEFKAWSEVKPFSTDRIKNRMASGDALPRGNPDWQAVQQLRFVPAEARREPMRWNLAPWAEFRTYMDLSLTRTLGALRDSIRTVDPATPVGIEGTQMPHAFGGYDLERLASVLDWVEPYDIGNAREVFGSFMPGKPILTTVFETGTNHARRRLWHLLLEGDRGCVIWWSEDSFDWSKDNLPLTPKALALQPVLREMTSPMARVILNAKRERDPVYIHYSQPSIQVNWLLESTVDGSTWPRRFSSFEADHNRMAKVRNAWLKALQDLGLSPQFVGSAELARWRGKSPAVTALVLPQSSAMSDAEVASLRELSSSAKGADGATPVIFADGLAGLFDEHGRLRESPPALGGIAAAWDLDEVRVFGRKAPNAQNWKGDLSRWPAGRLSANPSSDLWSFLESSGLRAGAPVIVPARERVRVHRLRVGPARVFGFERNIDYQMSEDLKQAGGNGNLEKSGEVTVRLAEGQAGGHLYDLNRLAYVGEVREWTFQLDPWRPSLFVLLPDKVAPENLVAHLAKF